MSNAQKFKIHDNYIYSNGKVEMTITRLPTDDKKKRQIAEYTIVAQGDEILTLFPRFILRNWPLIVLSLMALTVRLLTMPAFIETREGIFYVRGVVRYSVAELRPYWPGYPVYMWLGKLFNLVLPDPVLALHVLAVVSSTLCIWPIAALTSDWRRVCGSSPSEARLAGFAAALLWTLMPLSWLGGSEIFGDPLALLLGLVLLWMCWRSLNTGAKAGRWLLLAAALGGLMLGVRLAHAPLLLVFIYATWLNRKSKFGWRGHSFLPLPVAVIATLLLSISLWLGWQVAIDGPRFFELGNRQLGGHYGNWGNSVVTDKNLLSRPGRLLETGWVYGLGGWTPHTPGLRLLATLGLVALMLVGILRLVRSSKRTPFWMALLWFIPYLLWTLLNYDVDLARYTFPLVVIACIAAGLGLPRRPILGVMALLGTALALAAVSVPLALEHQVSLPIGQRLTNYVQANLNPLDSILIVTDDVPQLNFFMAENVAGFRTAQFKDEDIEFQTRRLEAQRLTVYAVFLPEKGPNDWMPIARLCQGRFMDSRGPYEVWLYRHTSLEPSNSSSKDNLLLSCSSGAK